MGRHLKFEQFNEHELINLTDEELVEYIVNARDAGRTDLMATAIGIFAYRREEFIMARIALKNVPVKDRDQVFMEVVTATLAAKLRGSSVGELVNLLKSVIRFKIADYFEKNRHELKEYRPPEDGTDFYDDFIDSEEDIPGSELHMVVEQLIDAEPERKQRAIRLRIEGYPSKEAAAIISREFPDEEEMSYMNVDQILSRFKKTLRKLLNESGGL